MTFEEWWRKSWGNSWKDGAPVSDWSSGQVEQSKIACKEAWEARVPEGYVIVPVEPTGKMESALEEIFGELKPSDLSQLITAYKAMIKAAQEEE